MSIENELAVAFDCHSLLADNQRATPAEVRRDKKRTEKRQRILAIQDRFADVWESDQRPESREAAVAMLTPLATYMLSFVFKMLARKVIEWLWDRYTKAEACGEFHVAVSR